jgi:alpha-mannosidase
LDGQLGLTLLRSPTWPYKDADKCKHTFTYSLYAHKGRLSDGDTVRLAFDLNNPMFTVQSCENGGDSTTYSMLECENANVVVDTVKMAEEGNMVILRLYETHRIRTQLGLKLGFPFKKVYKCDLMEKDICEVASDGNTVKLPVNPYEIVTLKFVL